MTALFLSRARLKRDAPAMALARLLVPQDDAARAAAAHHLVWSLFTDGAERQRDFLWREEAPGRFMTLSARAPADPHGLFDLECKSFEPALAAGDRLGFSLRANPAIARQTVMGKRGKRHDVVMDALHRLTPDERAQGRAAARPSVIVAAGAEWLARQGTAHGFTLCDGVDVDGYETVRIAREPDGRTRARQEPIRFGMLDLVGVLTVADPLRFQSALARGFGRSRAFGCGLMLIRRVPPS